MFAPFIRSPFFHLLLISKSSAPYTAKPLELPILAGSQSGVKCLLIPRRHHGLGNKDEKDTRLEMMGNNRGMWFVSLHTCNIGVGTVEEMKHKNR